MRIAIVGCGYVADFYMHTLPYHPELELVGVMDRDQERVQKFATYHGLTNIYETLDHLVNDPQVEIVVNMLLMFREMVVSVFVYI